MKNCTLIGYNAGVDLPEDAEYIVIIGDDIRDVENGARLAIGDTVFGEKCNLNDILKEKGFINDR